MKTLLNIANATVLFLASSFLIAGIYTAVVNLF